MVFLGDLFLVPRSFIYTYIYIYTTSQVNVTKNNTIFDDTTLLTRHSYPSFAMKKHRHVSVVYKMENAD